MEGQQHKPKYRGKSKPNGDFTLTYQDGYHRYELSLGADRFIAWMVSWLQMVSPELRRKALERIKREVN